MNRTEHLLTILSEECAEVSQRVSKALRFGLDEIQPGQPQTNAERISLELCDLLAIADMLESEGVIDRPDDSHLMISRKQAKVETFLLYSEELGRLER